jgi:hypothetical protein
MREYKEHVEMLITGVAKRWKGMAPAVSQAARRPFAELSATS